LEVTDAILRRLESSSRHGVDITDALWISMGSVPPCLTWGLAVLDALLEGDLNNREFALSRDAVRLALAHLTVTVEYEDFYGEKMAKTKEKLSFFGRHIDARPFNSRPDG
jgi:hypothetical protein